MRRRSLRRANNVVSSGLGYTSDSPQLSNRLPLTYEYNLDLQYEFLRGWVGDVGFVGTHGIHLYNWSVSTNPGVSVAGRSKLANSSRRYARVMIRASLPFNDPANAFPITMNTKRSTGQTDNERVLSFLGFSSGGVCANTVRPETSSTTACKLNSGTSSLMGCIFQVSYTWSKQFTNVDRRAGPQRYPAPGRCPVTERPTATILSRFDAAIRACILQPLATRRDQAIAYDLPWKHTEGLTGKVSGRVDDLGRYHHPE